MNPLFISPLPLAAFNVKPRTANTCHRHTVCANINQTTNTGREDEIAAKIASLRKHKRLKSQSSSASQPANAPADGQPSSSDTEKSDDLSNEQNADSLFSQLPDWKKEQVLNSQIEEAEGFFNAGSQNDQPDEESEDGYEPKVQTWGVFPRPDNISKAFGGGRRIERGGENLNSPDSKRRDEAVKTRLAAYRAARGIDMDKEEEHREELEHALEQSQLYMRKSLPYDAIKVLEAVLEFTSFRSRLGGKLILSLALSYETVGRREDAKNLYVRLRRNSFPDISSKAKQLLEGFAAMESLGIEDETRTKGYRVANFSLPDVNFASEKRYETAALPSGDKKSEKISPGTSLALLAVMASPALLIGLLVMLQH